MAEFAEMAAGMKEAIDGLVDAIKEEVVSEETAPENEKTMGGGHGSTLYKDPEAPQIHHYEEPNAADRELYHRALAWMEQQIEPTVTEATWNQWLPTGGARLDIRSYLRDNMAGLRGTQRSDWVRVSETIKPAPPVKVGIMLDGSGSMNSYARPSASIAWAAANAAAQLPESRTVSVVYGNAAQVTQEPGHLPARQVAVSRTDGGTEEFIDAARMVEEALWLNDDIEEDQKSNVLIIIISDLHYCGTNRATGESQAVGFMRIVADWAAKGYQVVVVGGDYTTIKNYSRYGDARNLANSKSTDFVTKTALELFR